MWIRTRPASATISLEARVPTSERPAQTQQTVSFRLLPTNERDHLDLDTGEVFQDYNYARMHKKQSNLIDASITIQAVQEISSQQNVMRYLGGIEGDDFRPSYPPSILFCVFLEPTAFRELAADVRGGLVPETITIELFYDSPFFPTSSETPKKKAPLEFGWEPDGSGLIWHNKDDENKIIKIESIRFEYAAVKPRYDEGMDRLLPMQSDTPIDRISKQVTVTQIVLADIAKHLRWATIGIISLAIMIAFVILRQRIPF